MNDRERRRIIHDSRTRLDTLELDQLLERIHEAESAGYQSPRFDPNGSGPATVLHCFTHEEDNCACGQNTPVAVAADRTGDSAVGSADGASDALRRMDLLITAIAKATVDLHAIRSEYILSSTQRDRLQHPDADDPDATFCEVVARVKDKKGQPKAREEMLVFSDVQGALPVKMRLGRWAYDFVRDTGRLPTLEQIEAHIEGRLVRRKAS